MMASNPEQSYGASGQPQSQPQRRSQPHASVGHDTVVNDAQCDDGPGGPGDDGGRGNGEYMTRPVRASCTPIIGFTLAVVSSIAMITLMASASRHTMIARDMSWSTVGAPGVLLPFCFRGVVSVGWFDHVGLRTFPTQFNTRVRGRIHFCPIALSHVGADLARKFDVRGWAAVVHHHRTHRQPGAVAPVLATSASETPCYFGPIPTSFSVSSNAAVTPSHVPCHALLSDL